MVVFVGLETARVTLASALIEDAKGLSVISSWLQGGYKVVTRSPR